MVPRFVKIPSVKSVPTVAKSDGADSGVVISPARYTRQDDRRSGFSGLCEDFDLLQKRSGDIVTLVL